MAWSVLQSASHNDASGAVTVAATFGALTNGTKLLAFVATDTGTSPTVSGVSDGTNSFTKILEQQNGGTTSGTVSLWVLDHPNGSGLTITATTNVTSASSILIQEVSGLSAGTTGAVDGTAAGTNGTATGNAGPPSYTTTASNEFLAYAYGDNGGPLTWSTSQPAGYTQDPNGINTNSNADIQVAYKNSTNGTETGSYSLSGTATGWAVLMAAFKVPAGAVSRPALPLQAVQPLQPPRPAPSQVINAPVAYRPVVTLSGTGTLTAGPGVGSFPQVVTPVAQPPQPAQPPPGRLIGLTVGAFLGSATLSGSGTLAAAPYFAATGTVLSGSGTLAAAYTVIVPGTGIIQAPLAQPPQPPPPPPSQITGAAPSVTFTVGATLSGTGTLTTAPFFSGAATLSGSGTLTAGPGVGGFPVVIQPPPPQPAQPPLPSASRILTAPPALLLGSATLTGSGTLAAAPYFAAAAALSGTGTLAAAYTVAGAQPYVITTVIQPPQPVQPPPGRVLTAPSVTLLGGATLTGSGTLSAVETISIAAALSGIGTLAASYVGPPVFQVARSTPTVTDPRDGTPTVTATATSSPGVT